MDITILKNKNYLKNKKIINKYKFMYIEGKFSYEIMQIFFNMFGFTWKWKEQEFIKIILETDTLNNFANQFEVYKFDTEISAKDYLIKECRISLEDKIIFDINKYQIFWFLTYKKQKEIFSYTFL